MLKKLKKILKSEKGKSIFDIVLYGSAVKGKSKPQDIDILVIFKYGSLKERLNKIQEIKNKLKRLELNIDVKALPGGVDLVGNFSIIATADKTEINSNEALNVSIEVLSNGNLEDIKSFKPHIQGVNIFDEKAVVNGTKLTQKIAFVAENDFIIAPFTLRYFDPVTKEIKTTSTNEISVKVKNAKPKEELTIKRDESKEMSAEECALHIYKATKKRKKFLTLTTQGKFVVFLNKWAPGFMDKMVYNTMAKEADSPLK